MIREYLKLRKEQRQFENLMIVMKLTGCKLIKHTRIRNGHILKVSIPPTLSFSDIEKKKMDIATAQVEIDTVKKVE